MNVSEGITRKWYGYFDVSLSAGDDEAKLTYICRDNITVS